MSEHSKSNFTTKRRVLRKTMLCSNRYASLRSKAEKSTQAQCDAIFRCETGFCIFCAAGVVSVISTQLSNFASKEMSGRLGILYRIFYLVDLLPERRAMNSENLCSGEVLTIARVEYRVN